MLPSHTCHAGWLHGVRWHQRDTSHIAHGPSWKSTSLCFHLWPGVPHSYQSLHWHQSSWQHLLTAAQPHSCTATLPHRLNHCTPNTGTVCASGNSATQPGCTPATTPETSENGCAPFLHDSRPWQLQPQRPTLSHSQPCMQSTKCQSTACPSCATHLPGGAISGECLQLLPPWSLEPGT